MTTDLRKISVLAALALALAPDVRAQSTGTAGGCSARFAGLCDSFRADPRVAIRVDGSSFLLNPSRTGHEVLSYPPLAGAIAAGVDEENLEQRIRPAFQGLTSVLSGLVEALPADSPVRRGFAKRLPGLVVSVVDRERCAQLDRPFVAGFDGSQVMLCPWMTHLGPEMLLSALAHELGHFVDPCWGREGVLPTVGTLPPFPASRATDCSGDEEVFADLVGATLTASYLRRGASALRFPTRPDERAATLLFYTLQPECSVAGNARLTPFFSLSAIQDFLGCSGP